MEKPVVFVIGASGKIGSATVRSLSSEYQDQVSIQAGTRNPDKNHSLKSLPGVTVVKACMGDDALVDIFSGVSTLFIVTPPTENRVSLVCSTALVAKKAGVKHLLVVSAASAEVSSTMLGAKYSEIEKNIPDLGIPYTFIRLPNFTDSLVIHIKTIVSSSSFQSCLNPDAKFGTVVVEDVGHAAAAILVQPSQYANTTLPLYSDFTCYRDVTDNFSQVLGKKISYIQVPIEETRNNMLKMGLPEWQAKGLLEICELINNAHPAFASGDLGVLIKITGNSATDTKRWITKHAENFK